MTLSTATTSINNPGLQDIPPVICDVQTSLTELRQHPLFQHLTDSDFNNLATRIRVIDLDRHELLYRQDTDASHFYFVVDGRLRLYRLDYSGYERTLDSIGPGDCLAEVMIYAMPARYACYAESLKRTRVLSIPIRAYRLLIQSNPTYTEIALTHYASRAVSRFHDLEIMTIQSARDRLIRYLLNLLPADTKPDGEIELPLPKCLIASRLAMQPETFSRILAELKANGLIRVNRSKLYVSDPQRLKEIGQ